MVDSRTVNFSNAVIISGWIDTKQKFNYSIVVIEEFKILNINVLHTD